MSARLFYLYAHYRLDGSVFYIGKGQGKRAWSTSNRTSNWKQTREQHGLRVEIWCRDLSEHEAFALEREWIRLYGRQDLGTGPLVNLTEGGEGFSGAKHTPETCAAISQGHIGKTKTPEVRARMSAAQYARGPRSAETRAKMSESAKRRNGTPERRAEISQWSKNLSPELRAQSIEKRKLFYAKKKRTQAKENTE